MGTPLKELFLAYRNPMKLSIIIPCWNEEMNVPRFVNEVWPVLAATGEQFEVIIVDDGSTDRTVEEIKKIIKPEVRLVDYGCHQGLGAAVRAGINAATGDYTIILDSDLTFHPSLISRLLAAKREHTAADFIIGSPQLGGYGVGIPAWRLVISKLANFIYYILLGKKITSINQIFRLYTTAYLKKLSLTAIGFDINAEILFKLVFRGHTFIEIPAELTQRQFGVSKLNYVREIRRHLMLILKILKWKFFGFESPMTF